MPGTEQQLSDMADLFEASRIRLRAIAALHSPVALSKRFTPDDILQETWLAAVRRMDSFFKASDVPAFVRFRTLLMQTLADLERSNLLCQKRDASKEVDFDAAADGDSAGRVEDRWNLFCDTISSPRTRLARRERVLLIRETLKSLGDEDRTIIEMRNFENLTNTECAAVLGIELKAASIRYVRALKRFREKLLQMTEFR